MCGPRTGSAEQAGCAAGGAKYVTKKLGGSRGGRKRLPQKSCVEEGKGCEDRGLEEDQSVLGEARLVSKQLVEDHKEGQMRPKRIQSTARDARQVHQGYGGGKENRLTERED